MDDGMRRELDELRRRAYGPDADILADPAALARLVELEDRARGERRPAAAVGTGASSGAERPSGAAEAEADGVQPFRPADAPVLAIATAAPGAPPSAALPAPVVAPPARPRSRWHAALTAGVAVVAIALAAGAGIRSLSVSDTAPQVAGPPEPGASAPAEVAEAYAFAYGPRSSVLGSYPVSGERDDTPRGTPSFAPGDDVMLKWFEPIGAYFDAQVSVADSILDDTVCLLLGSGGTHLRCVSHSLFEQGALLVTVPFDELTDAQRPATMTEDQSLGFWWVPGGDLLVVIGDGTVG